MASIFEKIRRTSRYHYYRLKNGWHFPSTMAHLTGGNIARGSYEPAVSALLKRTLDEGDLFLDIGANVGYYSRLAADIVGNEGKIYAFEADHENFHALSKNLKHLNNAVPLCMAVSDQNSFLTIRHSSHSSCHSLVSTVNYLNDESSVVPSMSIDHFWEHYLGRKFIKLMKIDVEGAELLVLHSMEKLVEEGKVGSAIIEFCPEIMVRAGIDPLEFLELLSSYFNIRIIEKEYHAAVQKEEISSPADFKRLTNFLMEKPEVANSNLFCRLNT